MSKPKGQPGIWLMYEDPASYKPGVCLVRVPDAWFAFVARVLRTFKVGVGLRLTRTSHGRAWRLDIDGVALFSGNVWVGPLRKTGYNTDNEKPWVKVVLSTGTASEQLGPPSNPVPDGEVWFEKANTFGDARVDRVG